MTERFKPEAFDASDSTGFISHEAIRRFSESKRQEKSDAYMKKTLAELNDLLQEAVSNIAAMELAGDAGADYVLSLKREATWIKGVVAAKEQLAEQDRNLEASKARARTALKERMGELHAALSVLGDSAYADTESQVIRGDTSSLERESGADEPAYVADEVTIDGIVTDLTDLSQELRCVFLQQSGVCEMSDGVYTTQPAERTAVSDEQYFTISDQRKLQDMESRSRFAVVQPAVGETMNLVPTGILPVMREEAPGFTVQPSDIATSGIPSPEQIISVGLAHKAADRVRDINDRFSTKTKILAGVALVAAISSPWAVPGLKGLSHDIAANASLQLPEKDLELPDECITSEKYDNAPARQLVSGIVPFDLKKPDGTSFKFNDESGAVRVGNDIVVKDAEIYLGACERDEKEPALSVEGTTITIHRDKVKSQLIVAPSDIEGAISASPVNSDIAKKLEIKDDAIKSKLVSYLEGDTYTSIVHNSVAAIGEGAFKSKDLRANFNKALDGVLIEGLKDDIESIAKHSGVDADKFKTEMQGEYSQIDVLNEKKNIEGATVIDDLVTVKALEVR